MLCTTPATLSAKPSPKQLTAPSRGIASSRSGVTLAAIAMDAEVGLMVLHMDMPTSQYAQAGKRDGFAQPCLLVKYLATIEAVVDLSSCSSVLHECACARNSDIDPLGSKPTACTSPPLDAHDFSVKASLGGASTPASNKATATGLSQPRLITSQSVEHSTSSIDTSAPLMLGEVTVAIRTIKGTTSDGCGCHSCALPSSSVLLRTDAQSKLHRN
mmetsp:Transcript_10243/g.23196  ORF Transcript_10243/g.23196 Transcript_10243/m.23196 type:complete len:215 (-) Transcript_10243:155-799(-)